MTKAEKACREIRAATKESQVIGAVKDYIDSLTPADATALPEEILALGLTQAEEVIQSGLQALHSRMEGRGEKGKNAILSEASLVFTTAARRLAALAKDPV